MTTSVITSVASKVPFCQLAVLLDKISDMEGKDRKKKLLKDFIDEWRAFHIKLHGPSGDLVSFVWHLYLCNT